VQQLSGVQVREAENHRVPCPNCSQGEVVERRSKRGKTFYGCKSLSRLRFRGVGKADEREVPGLRLAVPDREVAEGGAGGAVSNGECKHKHRLSSPSRSPLKNMAATAAKANYGNRRARPC